MREVAVVSGAGSGIGRAVAERLAADGYRVACIGRRVVPLEATVAALAGDGHLAVPADLTVPEEVQRAAAAVSASFGAVDALVHCAGALAPAGAAPAQAGGPMPGSSALRALHDQLLATFDANVAGTALLTEALRPVLRDDRARVVATSSIAAFRGGGPAYGTAKAALHAWAYAAAQDLGGRRITVNVVAPGYVADTELFGEVMTEARHAQLVAQTLVGRAGRPGDVAALCAYLVSADAGYLTAQVIQINGGALAG